MIAGLFDLTFLLAAPFWALMILAPAWSWTRRIVTSPLIAVAPLIIYLVVMVPVFGQFWAAVSTPELTELQVLLGSPAGAAAIWAHLIAFDLLIGRWMFLDARSKEISSFLVSPILVLTILLSPIGFGAYLVVRYTAGRDKAQERDRTSIVTG